VLHVGLGSAGVVHITGYQLSMNHHHITEAQAKIFEACASGNKAEIFKLTAEGCDLVRLHNEYHQTPLHIACQCRQFDIVRLLLLVYGASPDIPDNKGCTPLHEACLAGDLNTVAFLLGLCSTECESMFTDTDVHGDTILHKACQSGNVATVRYIVARIGRVHSSGCKLNLYQDNVTSYNTCKDKDASSSPCLPLSEYEMDRLLLKRCFEKSNRYGDTPLHIACRYGLLNVVKYIIDEARPVVGFAIKLSSLLSVACLTGHADIVQYLSQTDELDPEKFSCIFESDFEVWATSQPISGSLSDLPLQTACKCGNVRLVKTLLRDCRYSSADRAANGNNPLHCACISDVVDIIDLLIKKFGELHTIQNSKGNTPLHIACEWGSFNAACILITRLHCDPNVFNEDGETPLHLACKHGRLNICRLLLDNDCCNVTVQTSKTKETPLHLACCHTSPELVKCLLQRCTSNQDIPDVYGDTPLFNACRSGNIDVVQQLLAGKYCDSLYVNTRSQETPVHIACRMGRLDIVQVLLDGHKGQVNQQNQFGETVLHVVCQTDAVEIANFLVEHNFCDPNIKGQSGESPLFIACKRNQISIVQCLHNSTCNFNQMDANRNTPLHIACSSNALDIVKLLVHHCNIDAANGDGDTPLHVACKLNHHDVLECLLQYQNEKLDCLKNKAGFTPLHCACSSGAFSIMQLLTQEHYCNPAETDLEGNTALHCACITGRIDVAEYLITTGKCDLKKRNASGHPPLFCALEHDNGELVKHIVEKRYVDLHDTDHTLKTGANEYTPLLHFAYCMHEKHLCGYKSKWSFALFDNLTCNSCDLVKFLVANHYCDINQQDFKGNTLLHFVCKYSNREMLSFLLNTDACDVNCVNCDGSTPLHLAHSDLGVVKMLLGSKKIKAVSPRDKNGKTPIQLTHNYDIIRLLIGYGANPQDVYEHYGQILERYKKSQPLHSFMKVFVLGNSEAGKSTLVESLKTETPDPTLVVSDVEGPTAGVVKIECNNQLFGEVLFHDFAGQPEFESSHSAFLESSLSPSPSCSPPIFFLVVNVNNTCKKIIQHLQYWLSFIKNYCGYTEVKPHAIIIGSHADLLTQSELSASLSSVRKALDVSKQSVLECFDPLLLDCRKPGSEDMELLRTLLKESCSSLRRYVELDSQYHVLFAYIHEQFTRVPAVTVGELQKRIRGSRRGGYAPGILFNEYSFFKFSSLGDEIYFQPRRDEVDIPLPFVDDELIKLLDVLHDRGHLLLLKGASEIKNYWIVLDQDTLLKTHGTIFAPQDFEHHLTVETNTGVVPSSKIDKLFPHLDPNMVKQFLEYSELCQKIEDDETLRLILESGDKSYSEQSLSISMDSESLFFFFPGLIRAKRPVNIWTQPSHPDYSYSCGWCVQCKLQQFLTPRFLQVLLLRLVFSYAAAINQDSDPVENSDTVKDMDLVKVSGLNRICDVWKNGTHWCTRDGVEVLVEVIEQNTMVLLLMRCVQGQEMECVKLRSAIVRKILAAKEKFCSQVEMQEYFLDASDVSSYPTSVDKLAKVDMKEVIKTVQDAAPCILHQGGMISLNKLLYFEPYSTLGKELLNFIFDSENNDKKVPTETLLKISTLRHPALQHFTHMLQVPCNEVAFYQETWQKHPSFVLHHVFEYWQGLKTNGGTFLELQEEFDKYSIFCGRNPLACPSAQVCTRPTKDTLNVQ